jgi:2-polyprenyl-3-methyl-5-hydroxy-6-metoxy-1,4-benzoquinol methylase
MKQFWEDRFGEKEYAYGTEPNDFLASIDYSRMTGKVLCIAEGQGRNAVYLAGLGFEVVAMDQSEMGLQRAKELANEKNVTIQTICANLDEFDFGNNKWDGIVTIFGHLPSVLRKKVHARIANALKPNGFFILEGYSKSQLGKNTGGPQDADMLYDLEEIISEIGPALKWQWIQNKERMVIEGHYHTGNASVVQLFGIKP